MVFGLVDFAHVVLSSRLVCFQESHTDHETEIFVSLHHFSKPGEEKKLPCPQWATKLSFVGGTMVMHNHLMLKQPALVKDVKPGLLRQSLLQDYRTPVFSEEKRRRLSDLLGEMMH